MWTAFAPRRRGDHVPFTYWALSRRNPWLKLQMAGGRRHGPMGRGGDDTRGGGPAGAGRGVRRHRQRRRPRGRCRHPGRPGPVRGRQAAAADDREAVVNRLYDLSRSRERAAAYDRLRDAVRRRDDPAALAAAEAFLAAPYFNAATPADPREPGVREAYQAAFARWFVRLDDPAAPDVLTRVARYDQLAHGTPPERASGG